MDTLRKKLIFRAWHRGTREMDLVMGRFAQAMVPGFAEDELRLFEELMTQNDPDLYEWLTGAKPVPEHCDHGVMHKLRAFYVGSGA